MLILLVVFVIVAVVVGVEEIDVEAGEVVAGRGEGSEFLQPVTKIPANIVNMIKNQVYLSNLNIKKPPEILSDLSLNCGGCKQTEQRSGSNR